jgi:methyl-accepting chemotaxis protein
VATAAEQQRATTEEMNRNVHRISQVAETTAEQSVEARQAIEQLSTLSVNLRQETHRFKFT